MGKVICCFFSVLLDENNRRTAAILQIEDEAASVCILSIKPNTIWELSWCFGMRRGRHCNFCRVNSNTSARNVMSCHNIHYIRSIFPCWCVLWESAANIKWNKFQSFGCISVSKGLRATTLKNSFDCKRSLTTNKNCIWNFSVQDDAIFYRNRKANWMWRDSHKYNVIIILKIFKMEIFGTAQV